MITCALQSYLLEYKIIVMEKEEELFRNNVEDETKMMISNLWKEEFLEILSQNSERTPAWFSNVWKSHSWTAGFPPIIGDFYCWSQEIFCSGISAGDSNTWMHSDSLWETIWKTSYQKISSVLLTHKPKSHRIAGRFLGWVFFPHK